MTLPFKTFNTPVLMVIFNRPETTRIVFDEIRRIRPPRLYVAADGPRAHVATDKERSDKAKEIIHSVDWPCEVKTLFRKENLGCGRGVSGAISWFFEHEEKGIILEDDCLPSQSFFWYCEELLERYRDDNRVMHIGGNNFQAGWKNEDYSYYFSRSGHIWGWATWRRAWNLYDFDITLYEKVKDLGFFDKFFLNRWEKMYRLRFFEKVVANRGKVTYWAYQWDFCRYIHSGLSIVPVVNLVKNIGFGDNSTHTKNIKSTDAELPLQHLQFPLQHPPYAIRDLKSDSRYFSKFIKERITSKLKVIAHI